MTGGVLISRGHPLLDPVEPDLCRTVAPGTKGTPMTAFIRGIVDVEIWERVSQRLAGQTQTRRASQPDDHSFLVGKLYDDRGNRMGASYATKAGGAGETTFRERSSKVATRTPDPSPSRRVRSCRRCSTRSKASSSHPSNSNDGFGAPSLLGLRVDDRLARPGRMYQGLSGQEDVVDAIERVTIGAEADPRSCSASPLPSMASVEH